MRKYYQGIGGKSNNKYLDYLESEQIYFAEEKYDGIWVAGIIDQDGKITFWSRNSKKKTEGDIFKLEKFSFPHLKDSILIGELMAFSQTSKKLEHIKFNIFDIIKINNIDIADKNILERKKILDSLNLDKEYFSISKIYFSGFKNLYNEVIKKGGEGIVLKKYKGKTPYIKNSRNPYWIKIKKEVTISYVVVGFNDSDCESWKGEVKSIVGGLYKNGKIIPVCNIGSMPGRVRRWFSQHRKEAIGMVVECKGFEIFKSGALRHPSFLREREDLEIEDCNFSQLSRS